MRRNDQANLVIVGRAAADAAAMTTTLSLSRTVRRVNGLRHARPAEAAVLIAALLDDLARIVADEQVADDCAAELVMRAHLVLHPRIARIADRRGALAGLRAAVEAAEDPTLRTRASQRACLCGLPELPRARWR
ncbi:hypothetical protein [Actinoplanes sp. NPDC049802]|uniref:hypothetical protein n=1 Tax=Actinoplanes sp. NPDC049802 TaxID=3154742 RepID=UPI0033E04F94